MTSRGDVSSHRALVARQMGTVCVFGTNYISINYQKRTLSTQGVTLREGDNISIDDKTGEVFAGHLETAPSEVTPVLAGSLQRAWTNLSRKRGSGTAQRDVGEK